MSKKQTGQPTKVDFKKYDFKYTPDAELMLEQMKDFERDEFESWYWETLRIGPGSILSYLAQKKQLAEQKAELKRQQEELKKRVISA